MSDCDLPTQPPGFVTAERLPIALEVEIASRPGVVETLEGAVAYRTGDAIVTGTRGERWPIERMRFGATYDPCPGTQPGLSGRYRRRPLQVSARQLSGPIEVVLPDGRGTLRGAAGDWLVESGDQQAIVAGDIFATTYRIVSTQQGDCIK